MNRLVSWAMVITLLMNVFALAFFVQPARATGTIYTKADFSTPPPTQWSRTYGGAASEIPYSVVQTNDGGYAMVGDTDSFGAGASDFWLVKTDAGGNVQWSQTYGGTYNDHARSVVQTSDGGYAIGGDTVSLGSPRSFWLVKTNSVGTLQWSKTYTYFNSTTGVFSAVAATSMIQTNDGGYALLGIMCGDAWLVKVDASGNEQWNKTYSRSWAWADYALSVVQTSDGGYAIGGETRNGPSSSISDFWLVKTDAGGNVQWSQTYGGTYGEGASSVIQTNDGGYALAGWTYSFGAGASDFWLVKTDAGGNVQWSRTYGGAYTEGAYSVIQTNEGGYAIVGHTNSFGYGVYFWLVKTDAGGSVQWSRTYGGGNAEVAYSVIQTNDGGYALAGYTTSFGAGGLDFWLVKVSSDRPIAIFTSTIEPDGYRVTFDASNSYDTNGVIVNYDWDFGDGKTSTGKIVMHEYGRRSVYAVELTVTDNDGLTNSTTKIVTLGNLKAVSIEPVQVMWGVDLVQDKATDFQISYESTFDEVIKADIKVEAPSFIPTTYQFAYQFASGSHKFIIGNVFASSPFFQAITKEASFKFTVDPDNLIVPETDETDNTFPRTDFVRRTIVDTQGLRILFVPVRFYQEDGEPGPFNGFSYVDFVEHAEESIKYLKATYPIAESELRYYVNFLDTPFSAGFRPPSEDEATWAMAQLIRDLDEIASVSNYDRIVGVVRTDWFTEFPDDPHTSHNWQKVLGFSILNYGPRAAVVRLGHWKTTAHEIGHTYGLADSNDDGDGYYVFGRSSVNSQTFMSTGATPNPPAQEGHRMAVPNFWVRTDEYQTLLGKLRVRADPETLLVSGAFYRNGTVLLDDWYRVPSGTPDYEEGSIGNYSIVQIDNIGEALSTIGFNVTFTDELHGISFNEMPFAFTIPYENGAKTIQILNATGEVVASKIVSDNPPTVHVISPNGGEILTSDQVQISWEASDLDGDPLVYSLLISGDEGLSWNPIEIDWKQTTYNLTLTSFSGGNKYIVKVIASDGINTGEDVSDGFFTIASFTTNVLTPPQIVPLGGKANFTLDITSYGGFSNPITLNASSPTTDKLVFRWVNGSTIVPLPNGSTTAVLEVEVPSTTEGGNHTLILSGTSNNNTQVAINYLFAESHDLAVTNVTSSKTVVGQGFSITINVTIQNQGNLGETITINIFSNQTLLLNQSTYLPPRTQTNLTLAWNTSGFVKGNYTISAYASPVPDETNTADNMLSDSWVFVSIPGDVIGPVGIPGVPDRKVDLRDVFAVGRAFGAVIGDPRYNPNLDIDGNGKIDLKDYYTTCKNYGKSWQ